MKIQLFYFPILPCLESDAMHTWAASFAKNVVQLLYKQSDSFGIYSWTNSYGNWHASRIPPCHLAFESRMKWGHILCSLVMAHTTPLSRIIQLAITFSVWSHYYRQGHYAYIDISLPIAMLLKICTQRHKHAGNYYVFLQQINGNTTCLKMKCIFKIVG